jgi:acylphosphatase
MKHYTIHITGKVQGVFFRAYTKQKAEEWGIKGFVRNEQDGSVYIEAEAPENILEQFTTWCHTGPEQAVVSKVEIKEAPLKKL